MSDDDDNEDRPVPHLSLAKTRLGVEGGELVRRNESGGAVLRLPLDDVEGVEFRRPVNVLGVAFLVVAGGMAAIGHFVSEYNVLTVLLYVGATLLGAFALIGIREDVIVITTRGGTVRIGSPNTADEIAGFVTSVRPLVGGR